MNYLYVFLQSNLLEFPVYFWYLRQHRWAPLHALLFVTVMNSLTHPVVYFGIMNLKLSYLQNILMAEFFAVFSEALILPLAVSAGLRIRPSFACFVISLLANLVSWQFAPVLTYLLWS